MEKLLVFIPAYNCEKQVTRVLSQLLDQRIAPWVGECIVVNNRSTDGTEATVQDWMARHPAAPVRLLRNDENYGDKVYHVCRHLTSYVAERQRKHHFPSPSASR